MTGGRKFSNSNLLLSLSDERRGGQKTRDDAKDATLKGLVGYIMGTNQRLILHAKNIGAWLSIRGTTVTGTVLLATEFCDFLFTRYNVTLLNVTEDLDVVTRQC